MVSFPPIDAPTAALIGGLVGFIADNVTAFTQKVIDSRTKATREKVKWYEEMQRLAKEIEVLLASQNNLIRISENMDQALPSEEDIKKTIRETDLDQLKNETLEVGGYELELDIENKGRPVTEPELRSEIEGQFLTVLDNELRQEYDSTKDDIRQRLRRETETYFRGITEHYASCQFELNESVSESLSTLLNECFVLSITGGLSEEHEDDILDTIDCLVGSCDDEIAALKEETRLPL